MSPLQKLRVWWTDRQDPRVSRAWLESLIVQEDRDDVERQIIGEREERPPGPTSNYTRTA